jgi:hypothetical protein
VKTQFKLQKTEIDISSKLPPLDTVPNEIITIPLIVHVLFNNASQNIFEAQIISQIQALNKDFRMLHANKIKGK